MHLKTALIGLALAASALPAQAATISIGDTLQIEDVWNSGSGLEISNATSTVFTGNGTSLSMAQGPVTFNQNSVSFTQNASWTWSSAILNGIEITDVTNPNAFAGWTVQQPSPSWPFTVSESGGSIVMNLEGAQTTLGDTLTVGLAAPAPAPGMGLAGLAMLILAGAAVKSRRTGDFLA
jgi:hypothetical protein